jgi:Phosphoenolpyruvate synthase/pyruvate phosphate dikinase
LNENILWLHELRLADLARVGGKNSSLGEMIGNLAGLGVSVPGGYATTADASRRSSPTTTCPSASSTSWPRWTSRTSTR